MWGIVPFPLMKINFVYQNNVANYKRKRPPKWSNIFCEYLNIKMCVVDWTRALAGNSDLTLAFWKFCSQFNLEWYFFSLFLDVRKFVFKMPQYKRIGAAGYRHRQNNRPICIAPFAFGECFPPIVTFQALFCQYRDNITPKSRDNAAS